MNSPVSGIRLGNVASCSESNDYLSIDVQDIVSKCKNNKSPELNITNELIKKGGDSICLALVKSFKGLVAIAKDSR